MNHKKRLHVSIGLLYRRLPEGQIEMLFQTRLENGPFLNYLEFPGGKQEEGETAEEALKREWFEEVESQLKTFSIAPTSWQALPSLHYSYPDREVTLYPFYGEHKEKRMEVYPPPFLWLTSKHLREKNWRDKIIPASLEIIDHFMNLIPAL